MRKNVKVGFAVLLTVILLLGAGCGKKHSDVPAGSTVNTTGNTAEPRPTGEDQLPEDMDIEFGVDQRDEDDLDATAPTTADGSQSAQKPESKPDKDTQTQSPTQPDSGEQTAQPDGDGSAQPDSGNGSTQPEVPAVPAPGSLTYQQFYQLDPVQQEAYTDSFESLSAFNKWFNEAKAAYESTIPDETVNGSVDIGKLNP